MPSSLPIFPTSSEQIRISRTAIGLTLTIVLTSLLTAGCSPNAQEQFALSGKVMIEDEALDRGMLVLVDQTDPLQRVQTPINNGVWSFDASQGPIAGRYDVLIVGPQPELEEFEAAMKNGEEIPLVGMTIPPQYANAGALAIEVGPGQPVTHEFRLEFQ